MTQMLQGCPLKVFQVLWILRVHLFVRVAPFEIEGGIEPGVDSIVTQDAPQKLRSPSAVAASISGTPSE